MTKKDNPLRLRRLGAGLSQVELARRAGIHRSSLVAIEDGATRHPEVTTLGRLGLHLGGVTAATLQQELADWHEEQRPAWSEAELEYLAATPDGDPIASASSFRAWRERLGVPVKEFAARLGVARATMSDYENGVRVGGMPDTILSGLMRHGVPPESAVALAELPPHDPTPEPSGA